MMTPNRRSKDQRNDPRRLLQRAAGYVFFAIGFIGMFLPVLPTTVFWIIAAICFAKSSPAMYRRILAWPRVGQAIGDFITHGIIRPASKRMALGGMAGSALLLIVLNVEPGIAFATVIGLSFAAGYVLTRPSGMVTASVASSVASSVIAKQE